MPPILHNPQRRYADADRGREDGPECLEAGGHGASRGKDVIDDEDVAEGQFFGVDLFMNCKCSGNIGFLFSYAKFCLCSGSATAQEDVAPHRNAESAGYARGYDFCLIISSFPSSHPMKRNRNDCIHI